LSLKGNAVVIEVPEWLTEKLRRLSQSEGSTLFITYAGLVPDLARTYSGQDDISVGAPVAGRRPSRAGGSNRLLRQHIGDAPKIVRNPSLREVLRRVREVTLEAQAHQDLPFEKLVEELRPNRTLSHGPLFQTMFVFQNDSKTPEAPETVAFSGLELNWGTEKNDITLQVIEKPNKLFASLSYSTDLFDESTIRRMTTHWQRILEAIAADPEQLLQDVEVLSSNERRQMLVEWNATASDFPENFCLSECLRDRSSERQMLSP
jgi:non-ribosomal peptide synthetase component F